MTISLHLLSLEDQNDGEREKDNNCDKSLRLDFCSQLTDGYFSADQQTSPGEELGVLGKVLKITYQSLLKNDTFLTMMIYYLLTFTLYSKNVVTFIGIFTFPVVPIL
jgi:hypothetical protein